MNSQPLIKNDAIWSPFSSHKVEKKSSLIDKEHSKVEHPNNENVTDSLKGLPQPAVMLSGDQMEKFLRALQSDAPFAEKLKELNQAGNEENVAQFLKENGFKLG